MNRKLISTFGAFLLLLHQIAYSAVITEKDSTQPRGTPSSPPTLSQWPVFNPVDEGFRSPASRAAKQGEYYKGWAGSVMANAIRDPAFFATLSVANQDLIDFINSLPGEPADATTVLGKFLLDNKLHLDITRGTDGRLQPEGLLPIAADLCLRCHTPVGWLEGHSEPPTILSPHLKGQFWGAAFLEHPVDSTGAPKAVDPLIESEAEMEGVQCDSCHRQRANLMARGPIDGRLETVGNGGLFVTPFDPFKYRQRTMPIYHIQSRGILCGTCHDVTNPLIKTKTKVGGSVPDMLHPIERTFSEWFWSDFRRTTKCKDCHTPMSFPGAQTWLLYPGLDMLWGDVDKKWRETPYNYGNVPVRSAVWRQAMEENRRFMGQKAATLEIVTPPTDYTAGGQIALNVKVTNLTGHKLPTGFAEGRQMWIHIKGVDGNGTVVFEDGALDQDGRLIRSPETKVYEQIVMAGVPQFRTLENRTCYDGYPFLDKDNDGCVDKDESHFRFVLMNYIQKDNRIPPKGYKKEIFNKKGAFVIPYDAKDTDYADGQYWDITPYSFLVPDTAQGEIRVTAILKYQTFNREYIEFLEKNDREPTQEHGGRARNLPTGTYSVYATWGAAMKKLWEDAGQGQPVVIGEASVAINPTPATTIILSQGD